MKPEKTAEINEAGKRQDSKMDLFEDEFLKSKDFVTVNRDAAARPGGDRGQVPGAAGRGRDCFHGHLRLGVPSPQYLFPLQQKPFKRGPVPCPVPGRAGGLSGIDVHQLFPTGRSCPCECPVPGAGLFRDNEVR